MDPYLMKRLWRRPWLSLCSLVLSCVLCFLVGFLTDYRQNQQEELSGVQREFPISCVVTDIRGTKSTDLRMDASRAEFVTDGPLKDHVRQVRLTKSFYYGCPILGISSGVSTVTGISQLQCADRLNPDRGVQVTWLRQDFFESVEPLLLVPEALYSRLEAPEEPLTLVVTDPVINPHDHPELATQEIAFQIAGYYEGSGNEMFMSYDAAQAMERAYFLCSTCDSISFLAANNRELDDLSQIASEMFGAVDPKAPAFTDGVALTIHDQQYRATVTALAQNIRRSGYLLPAVLALGVGVGFLLGFLSTRSEKKTYALMRTMGMTQGKLLFSVLREQLLPVILAALLALAVTKEPLPTIIYLLCSTAGCACCVIRAVRVPPTAILREQE